ncbi:hypothetical protein GCM10007904_16040 [Oharaeibacter diazotrophicus]|nr:hypothetical protein GCM10007904_16040 [Oharaeibacter diazotrophicus]
MEKTFATHGSDRPLRGHAHGGTRAVETLPSGGSAPSSKARRMVGVLAGAMATLIVATSAPASAETRTLDLYNAHTRERLTITFKKNGKYIPSALAELNHFLRDWRRNEQVKMDPRLFDTVWELYQRSGASQPIHVVCGYRSLATNEMLRTRSSGVAKHSQHTMGKAMDMFIPGVSINRLREIGVQMQHGGVGWYPTSGSPFVHIDVGNVRAWPRMTRTQLVRLFPDGKTVHLPSDGRPLAGYQQALAELKRGGSSRPISVAETSAPRKGGLLAMLFGGDEEDASEEVGAASGEGDAPARPAKPAKVAPPAKAAPPAAVVRTAPAPETPPPALAPVAPPVLMAAVPKPSPAPERPEPVAPTTLAAATPPAETPAPAEVEAVLAAAPLPTSRPDLPPLLEVAALEAPLPPPSRSEILPEPVVVADAAPVLAALPDVRPSLPTVEARTPPAAPAVAAEPANAQLALAEVAHDPSVRAGSATALGYAPASEDAGAAAAPPRPPIRMAALTPPPPAATRGLSSGQADPLAALPLAAGLDGKADPLVDAAAAPAAADLPIYDGAQSAYWGVFAQFVHPDQRRMGALFEAPTMVVVATFAPQPYGGDVKATRFTGSALPRLQVMRFSRSSDLAMR